MTAKVKRTVREPEQAEPDNGTNVPEGSPEIDSANADPKPSVSSEDEPKAEPPQAAKQDEGDPADSKSDRAKDEAKEAPSLFARFFRWWLTDLDGE